MQDFYLLLPTVRQKQKLLIPVFIPFAGCPQRCIYCAQELQSGTSCDELEHLYYNAQKTLPEILSECQNTNKEIELAFYGGTFTLLPMAWQSKWLDLASELREKGLIQSVRCSTRPDALSYTSLTYLKKSGLSTVEIGAQSFDFETLKRSKRYYTPKQATDAAVMVQDTGLKLVLQLLPGLPGSTPQTFAKDIEIVKEIKPEAVRIYPCLVIKNTELAGLWQNGDYRPWDIEETISALASALLELASANIAVIRMGLAPEETLLSSVLAGPWHPSLGNLVQARALYLFLQSKLQLLPGKIQTLALPRKLQGVFWGHGKELAPAYAALGLNKNNVTFWQWPFARLRLA